MRGDVPLREMIQNEKTAATRFGMRVFGPFLIRPYPFEEAFFRASALRFRRRVRCR